MSQTATKFSAMGTYTVIILIIQKPTIIQKTTRIAPFEIFMKMHKCRLQSQLVFTEGTNSFKLLFLNSTVNMNCYSLCYQCKLKQLKKWLNLKTVASVLDGSLILLSEIAIIYIIFAYYNLRWEKRLKCCYFKGQKHLKSFHLKRLQSSSYLTIF